MEIAIAQMNTTSNAERNLTRMAALITEAKTRGATFVAFPEMATFRGSRTACLTERDQFSQRMTHFSNLARQSGIALCPGTLREPTDSPDRWFNTLPVFSASGVHLASYRKIFLFRANLPGETYDEPAYCEPGKETKVVEVDGFKLGLSVCYDLRFPELYRRLLHQGAQGILAPASFTIPTGEAHWSLLTRCRALENLLPLAAPGQSGVGGDGLAAYGHSVLVSPWGVVEEEIPDGEGVRTASWSPETSQAHRRTLDVWKSQRNDLFPPE